MSKTANNPWQTTTPAQTNAHQDQNSSNDPWPGTGNSSAGSDHNSGNAWSSPGDHHAANSGDWLNSAPAPQQEHFTIMDPFHHTLIPLDRWVTQGIDWVVNHFRPVF